MKPRELGRSAYSPVWKVGMEESHPEFADPGRLRLLPAARAPTAFTLLELLVVIAIIVILAALMFPVISRTKSGTDSVVCKNNLRQFAIALATYTADSGAYPPGDWQMPLQPYLGKGPQIANFASPNGYATDIRWVQSVWACPSYNRMPGLYVPGGFGLHYGAYGYNAWGVCSLQFLSGRLVVLGLSGEYLMQIPNGETLGPGRIVKQAEVVAPSQMIAFADADIHHGAWNVPMPPNGFFQAVGGEPSLHCKDACAWLSDSSTSIAPYLSDMFGPNPGIEPWIKAYARVLQKRHRGRWNTTFCDAHVETLRPQQLHPLGPPYPFNEEALRRWNLDNLPHREMLDFAGGTP